MRFGYVLWLFKLDAIITVMSKQMLGCDFIVADGFLAQWWCICLDQGICYTLLVQS